MARKSVLETMTPETVAWLTTQIKENALWSDILQGLQDAGISTSESGLRRWCERGGLARKRRAARPSQARANIDVEENLEAQVTHLTKELAKAQRQIETLRVADAKEVLMQKSVEAAIDAHFEAGGVTIAPFIGHREAKGTPQEMLAAVSDAHYGEVVDPALAHGVSYSPEIARARMAYLRDKIIRYKDLRPYAISKLQVAVLGDMVSGNNHEDLDVSNALGQTDQAMDIADMLYGMAQDFAQEFAEVEFTVITGNHGRIHKVPRHKQRFENWDFVAGAAFQRMVEKAGLPVSVVVPRGSRHVISVAGRRVCLTHGDGVKAASFAGIPWYAMKSKADALQSLMRTLGIDLVDQILMGHFHQHIHWPAAACNIVVNGSIKGGDEFIMDTRYASTPAMQIIQEWHPRHGLTCTDYIDLEHVR